MTEFNVTGVQKRRLYLNQDSKHGQNLVWQNGGEREEEQHYCKGNMSKILQIGINNVHERDSEELAWKINIEREGKRRSNQATIKPETQGRIFV